MDIIQNLSAQVIFADGIRIKPAIPTEVPNFEELCKKYPAIKDNPTKIMTAVKIPKPLDFL